MRLGALARFIRHRFLETILIFCGINGSVLSGTDHVIYLFMGFAHIAEHLFMLRQGCIKICCWKRVGSMKRRSLKAAGKVVTWIIGKDTLSRSSFDDKQ